MRRREFIAGLGSAVTFWPRGTQGQVQNARIRFLGTTLPSVSGWYNRLRRIGRRSERLRYRTHDWQQFRVGFSKRHWRPGERHGNRSCSWSFGERNRTSFVERDRWLASTFHLRLICSLHGFAGFAGTGVTLTNAVSGSTSGSLSLTQTATGGAGGPGVLTT